MTVKAKMVLPILGMLLVIVIFSGLVLLLSKPGSSETGGGAVKSADRFAGGKFEASGVAHVAGTNGFLIVDDGKPGDILWVQFDDAGKQAGAIKLLKLGVDIDDPEGITTDGSYFYVIGSQSASKFADQTGMARFRFNKETQSIEDVQALSGMRRFLLDNVAELRGFDSLKTKDDGLSIEGLAWDPVGRRLLLGLRSPVVDGNALLIPLTPGNPGAEFTFENLEAGNIEAIRLPIGGMGIRGIEYDQRQRIFHIIAGATESQDKTDFKLWEWNGQPDRSGLRETNTFDSKLQPEGVASRSVGDRRFVLVVFDTSGYLTLKETTKTTE